MMTSSTNVGEQAAGRALEIPDRVKYSGTLPQAVPGRTTLVRQSPNNGNTFSPTNNNIIRFFINGDAFLDPQHSSLNMTIVNKSGANQPVRLSSSGYSVIRAWRTYGPDGTVIDQVQDCNVLMSALLDYQTCPEYRESVGANLLGLPSNVILYNTGNDADKIATASYWQNNFVIANDGAINVSLPLQFFLNNEKYLPLRAMSAPGIQLEIELAPGPVALRSGEVGTTTGIAGNAVVVNRAILAYEVQNPRVDLQMVHFSSSFYQTFDQIMLASGGVELHSQRWTSHPRSYPSGIGNNTTIISHRSHSVKSMISVVRADAFNGSSSAGLNNLHCPGDGARHYPAALQVQWRVGNTLYPPQTLRNKEEQYREVIHALGYSPYDSNYSNNVRAFEYAGALGDFVSSVSGAGEYKECFMYGIDFEAFAGEDMENGLDTATRGENIEILHTSTDDVASTLNTFVLDDMIVLVTPDGMCRPSV